MRVAGRSVGLSSRGTIVYLYMERKKKKVDGCEGERRI